MPDSPPTASFLRRNRRLGLGLLLALLAGGTLLLRFTPWSARDKDVAPYTATRPAPCLVITASGELQADRRVNISPRKQGLLKELMVEGDVVEAGEVVALMDPSSAIASTNAVRCCVRRKPTSLANGMNSSDDASCMSRKW